MSPYRKGTDLVLRAFDKIVNQYPENVYRDQMKYVFDLGVGLMREVKERVVSR